MTEFNVGWYEKNEGDKKEQYAKLAELGEAVAAALKEATDYATEHKLSFYFSPQYGMGGTFFGDPEENYEDSRVGWAPSAYSC